MDEGSPVSLYTRFEPWENFSVSLQRVIQSCSVSISDGSINSDYLVFVDSDEVNGHRIIDRVSEIRKFASTN